MRSRLPVVGLVLCFQEPAYHATSGVLLPESIINNVFQTGTKISLMRLNDRLLLVYFSIAV